MADVQQIEQGRIVWAVLPSSDRKSQKHRPAVILTSTRDIVPGEPLVAVALSTTFDEPLGPECVRLPWNRSGAVRTRLRKPTVAVCNWLVELDAEDIEQFGGIVPVKEMREIVQKVERMLKDQT